MVTSANRLRCVTLVFLAAATPAKAKEATTGDLYQACVSASDVGAAYCLGFVTGVWFNMSCAAEGTITSDVLSQTFKKWAVVHPEKWGDRAGFGVVQAIKSTWSCQ